MADSDVNIGELPYIPPLSPTDLFGDEFNLVAWAGYNVNISKLQQLKINEFSSEISDENLSVLVDLIVTENNDWNFSPIAFVFSEEKGFVFSFADDLNVSNDLNGDGVADYINIDYNFDGITDDRVYSGQFLQAHSPFAPTTSPRPPSRL